MTNPERRDFYRFLAACLILFLIVCVCLWDLASDIAGPARVSSVTPPPIAGIAPTPKPPLKSPTKSPVHAHKKHSNPPTPPKPAQSGAVTYVSQPKTGNTVHIILHRMQPTDGRQVARLHHHKRRCRRHYHKAQRHHKFHRKRC